MADQTGAESNPLLPVHRSSESSLLANSDRQDSDALSPQPEPPPEPPLQRTQSTEELLVDALLEEFRTRGFNAVERTTYAQGEKLRFSAVDREALDRELGSSSGSAAAAAAPELDEGDSGGGSAAAVPPEFRFSRCTTEFYHGTSLVRSSSIHST